MRRINLALTSVCERSIAKLAGVELLLQKDAGAIDDHLTGVLEVHRDPALDHRLHLPEAPIRLLRMAHEHSGLQVLVHAPIPQGKGPGMTPTVPDLAALVSARLCHDLISPIGAIGNGLELLELSGTGASPELALVNDSLATAIAKLRFFRLAFGPADPHADLTREEAVQICSAMFSGRVTVTWDAGDLPRQLGRIACLAILCVEKSLPLGGTLHLTHEGDDLAIRMQGRRTAPPADLWAHARDGTPLAEVRPDAVQFVLLARALAETGARLATRFDETGAEVRMTAPATTMVSAEVRT